MNELDRSKVNKKVLFSRIFSAATPLSMLKIMFQLKIIQIIYTKKLILCVRAINSTKFKNKWYCTFIFNLILFQ